MAYRLPAHLHRNRHGILYFRLSVPGDIQHLVGRREIYRSLNTASVREAADSAQTLRIAFRAAFSELRTLSMSDAREPRPTVDLGRLNDLLRATREKVRLRDRIEALEEEAFAHHQKTASDRAQHERELDIAIRAKGGAEPALKAGLPFGLAMSEFLKGQRKATTRRTYKGRLEHAQAFFGIDKDIRHIEQADLSEYAAHAKKDIANQSTAGFHISTLCGMLNHYRITKGWGPELTTKRLIEKKDTPDSDDRDRYSPEQLKALFLNAAKYRTTQPHKYWATVAAPFLGCRIEELAQINLHTDLLQSHEERLWYFDMNGRPDPDGATRKSMKNKASWRHIPIHSTLVEHGFVDYLLTQRNAGFSRPFESNWKPLELDSGTALKWSHYITNWGGRELKKLRASGAISDPTKKLSYFHSMRHTFSRCMGRAGIGPEVIEAALGHSYAGAERERYDKLKTDPNELSAEGIEPGLVELVALLRHP